MNAPVECRSEHTYPQRPVALYWGGERYPVIAIERQWRDPQGPAFRVRTAGEQSFDLIYLEAVDEWRIEPA
ncbi:MAG: hypothetical protein GYA17_10100 [Chloroflexi bacterium]|jgi:hypothetical protein|nr:hypothetical protein [Anaerolineaceae bacterium]NMB88702.1 hypothetical protein [Chloroflexota bacterium]